MSAVHQLKIQKKPYLDLLSGGKTGEVRDCSDRDFQVGDSVWLTLVDETGNPTGRSASRLITHIQRGYGLPDDVCVLSYAPQPQPAAHLTIPGALEWDGDNGTHGADGESRDHSESAYDDAKEACAEVERTGSPGDVIREMNDELVDLRAQLANTEQSRRSFFDLSQDLEKRLAYMVEAMNQIVQVSSMYEKPFEIATLAIGELSAMTSAPECQTCQGHGVIGWTTGQTPESFDQGEAPCQDCLATGYAHSNGMPVSGTCETCKGTGVVDDGELTHSDAGIPYAMGPIKCVKDCPDCSKPAKPKTCIECDQPYCHGVCVERGDQDYDRDQAAKGGDQ